MKPDGSRSEPRLSKQARLLVRDWLLGKKMIQLAQPASTVLIQRLRLCKVLAKMLLKKINDWRRDAWMLAKKVTGSRDNV